MNATPTISNTKIAQLIVNGRPVERGSFPAMKSLEKNYKGYNTHVGYAPFFNGMHYCKGCSELVVKPYVGNYQGHQYYRCFKCQTINYVN